MIHRRMVWLAGALSALMLMGCATARHVEVRPDGGIVAIPANTNSWPFYHRDKAIALIEAGSRNYEIVHEEEAVARRVTHVTTHSKSEPPPTLVFNGLQDPAEETPGPGGAFPGQPATIALPLGPQKESATTVAREEDITEWRIHYRYK